MSNEGKNPQASIEYPGHEWGRFIPTADAFPLTDILIGLTNPFPTYAIDRKATDRFVLLECILSGEGRVWLDGKWKPVAAGDVIFFNKDSDQRYRADQNHPFSKIYLSFASPYIDAMISAYRLETGIYHPDSTEVFETILALSRSYTDDAEYPFILAEHIQTVILRLARTQFRTGDSPQRLQNKLLNYVYKKADLDLISEEIGISKSTLIRTFKKESGITPYQFLLREKIRVARSLLKTTRMSVKEIAYLLCFTDEHYFTLYFRQQVGRTPSEYRRQ